MRSSGSTNNKSKLSLFVGNTRINDMFRYFYQDYCENKGIPSEDPWESELQGILHSMQCVLCMPENFFGIINSRNQTLQFMVENDESVTIDIPILENGEYIGSKQRNTGLDECLKIASSLKLDDDFYHILPPDKENYVR